MYSKIKNTVLSLVMILSLSFWVINIADNRTNEREHHREETSDAEELSVWYGNSLYESYFEAAAENFEKKYNVKVKLTAVPGMEYVSSIQNANKNMEGPDVYLTDSRYLQKLVRSGAAARTDISGDYSGELFYTKAWENMEYQDNIYGYPLGFDVAVLMYNKELVEQIPASFEDILNVSEKNQDIPVEQILTWNTNNFMYNYCFVGKYARIAGENGYEQSTDLNNEELVEAGKVYQKLCSHFLQNSEYSYEDVKMRFARGELRFAVVSTDVLQYCKDWEISTGFAVLPDLNDHLGTASVSVTDLAMVNEYSRKKKVAAEFAKYLSVGMADEMYDLCGILPLAKGKNVPAESSAFYEEYEQSRSLPKLMSALDYWNKMWSTLTEIRKGTDVASAFEKLNKDVAAQIKE